MNGQCIGFWELKDAEGKKSMPNVCFGFMYWFSEGEENQHRNNKWCSADKSMGVCFLVSKRATKE